MNQALLKYLVDPADGTPLKYDLKNSQLYTEHNNNRYNIESNVPILLKQQAEQEVKQSQHHELQQTNFHYVDHYQKDAIAFNYFEPYTDGATVHENRRLHEAIVKEIPKQAEVVLDVGSGGAWLAQALKNAGKQIISFDISPKNTKAAISKYPFENHHAVTGDVYALPFAPNSIDCIVTSEVIEHVPDPASFLACLLKVLKPQGKLVVTTPYNEKIQYSLCIHCNCVTPLHAHLHSFTKEKIKSLVAERELTNVETKTLSNKALTTLRTHVLLKYLPFRAWEMIDKVVNRIINKPARLMMKIVK